jgi:hypothetical protein
MCRPHQFVKRPPSPLGGFGEPRDWWLCAPKLDALMRAKDGVQALAVQPDFEDAKRNLATALEKR